MSLSDKDLERFEEMRDTERFNSLIEELKVQDGAPGEYYPRGGFLPNPVFPLPTPCHFLRVVYLDRYAGEPLKHQHEGDAGFDLPSAETTLLAPGERRLVSTGIKLGIPKGYEIQVRPRSGLAYKHGITVLNSPGTIDCGYTGEVKVLLFNAGDEFFQIIAGDRIAQAIFAPVTTAVFFEVDTLDPTSRSEGGFGHTGV